MIAEAHPALQSQVEHGALRYHGTVLTVSAKKTGVTLLRAEHLAELRWLVHGFSTRSGGFSRAYGKGDLNLGLTKAASHTAIGRNREAFLRKLGAVTRSRNGQSLWPLVTLRQIHS